VLPNDETFMSMLKNKEAVLTSILKDIEVSAANAKAFEQLEQLYKDGEPVSTDRALAACAKSLRHANQVNQRLLMIALVYASGGDFSADAGKVLVKMGRGEEALREMMRQKMEGR